MTTRLITASIAILAATLAAAASAQDDPVMSVQERGGVYVVAARFTVPEEAAVVREVLTDYAGIPRFMPEVRTSAVIEQEEGYARVEQEAVSRFMMFSKRVHLVLDVDEGAGIIRFRDRCKRSFARYEGAWIIREEGGRTEISYELNAQPAFSVPEFVLRKLFDRNSRTMIDRLRAEVALRATPPSPALSPR